MILANYQRSRDQDVDSVIDYGNYSLFCQNTNGKAYHHLLLKEDMKFDIAAAERALEFVAQNNGVTVEEVREEIAAAIRLASAQPDGDHSGTPPSPESLIAYAAEETVNRIMQLA